MKIPERAKCVFKGVIFDVYHWDQEIFDGSTATFEMIKRPDTVLIIPTMDGKVLLGNEEQPHYGRVVCLFGGRHDVEGESHLDAAKRELLEETGLASNDWELLDVVQPYKKIEWHIHTFVARDCNKIREQNLEPGERITQRAVDFDEFVEAVCHEEFLEKHLTIEILRHKVDGTLNEFKKKLFP